LIIRSRFRVESTDISDNDVRIKEMGSSHPSERLKQRQEGGAVPKRSSSLLRSQSVYTPKPLAPSGSRSTHLPRQNSLTATPAAEGPATWGPSPEEQPVFTKAGSLADPANVTFGFDLTQQKK
jgi:hypothetical protein